MKNLERNIGIIMRIGVSIAVVLMVAGIIMLLITGSTGYENGEIPNTFPLLAEGLYTFKPAAYMMLGVFCLILTPVLRVIASIFSFAAEKDKLYVAITVLVLLILIACFLVGYFL